MGRRFVLIVATLVSLYLATKRKAQPLPATDLAAEAQWAEDGGGNPSALV